LGEREITFDIRLPVISETASFVAQDARVREKLLPLQRKIVEKFEGAVVDGRDMGTVVFPDAILKIFLTASASERARRRLEELNKRGQSVGFQDLVREIEERDLRDSTRVASPLKAAPDAILMDSTNLGAEQVIQKILEFAKTKNLGFAGVKK
jgi:cytidylate kinase